MPKNPIQNRTPDFNRGMAFITFNPNTDEGRSIAQNAANKLTEAYTTVARTNYRDFESNISVRDQFSRENYEYFRPKEAIPQKKRDIILFCMEAYRRVGIVRNVIDLMADFCVQGIKLVHHNKQKQRFYRKWAKKVGFKRVSERYANMLFRAGNVVVRRGTAKISAAEEEAMMTKAARLEPDVVIPEATTVGRKVLPIKYTFLNPASLEIIGGELAQFTGKQIIALKISSKLRQQITAPNLDEKELVNLLPTFIVNAVKQGRDVIPLEQEKLVVDHYKKDDWQAWADPMTYAILDDLIILEKMKIADLAALDGAISQVRVWTLGDMEKGIMPTDAAIDRLAEILMSNPGGGAFDLIWGPDLKVQEYKTDVHQFLGSTKYEPVLQSIYQGLGIPPTLSGTEGASGTTNNLVSLQTMIQRLEYVRGCLIEFWEKELELVRQAMNFQDAAKVHFDRMTLSDEAAEKTLLISLWDRNLVSDEVVLERFKEMPELEQIRTRREAKERKRKLRQPKIGPYSNPVEEYIKIALGKGFIDPKDLDIEITTKPTPFDRQLKAVEKAKLNSGGAVTPKKKSKTNGRPIGKTDGPGGRKSRSFTARSSEEQIATFADFMSKNIWAKEAQRSINEYVNPLMLKFFNRSNLREMSEAEASKAEQIKFTVLANLQPFSSVDQETVYKLIEQKVALPKQFSVLSEKLTARAYDIHGRQPTLEERRTIQTSVYALLK